MDNVRPNDLPQFLDPLLDFLADHLPSSIYDTLFVALSYGLMLMSGLFSLVAAMPSLKPWEWDAQTILPPLIMFLTAYYTLLSLYRTTSFMVRMVFRVLKWGLVLGVLGAGAGWFAGMDANNGGAAGGLGALRDALQAQGRGAAGAGARDRTRNPNPRPRAYESFTAHEQWRYNEEEARRAEQADAASDAQRFIQSVAGFAGRAIGGAGWDVLSNAKKILDSLTAPTGGSTNEEGSASSGQTRKQPHRKAKASARRKTASR